MKILIYGEGYSYALAPELKKSFEKLHCYVEIFDYTSYLVTSKGYNLKNRILNRLMMPYISKRINQEFIRHVQSNTYDCIFVITGWHLKPETIDIVKRYTKCIVNWSMEELFNKVFSSFINPESYQRYDCIFSPRRHLFGFYYSKGIKRLEYLPFFYYDGHHPIIVSESEREIWGSDIAFFGTWSKDREKAINTLKGLNVKIWGSHWYKASKDFKNEFTLTNKMAWVQDMSKVVNSTKIIIDVLTKAQKDQINMKNYQIPACGGFLLTDRTDEILSLFEEGKEIVCYSTLNELRKKCEYYLAHDDERRVIANNLREKVINGRNNLLDRAKTILDIAKSY